MFPSWNLTGTPMAAGPMSLMAAAPATEVTAIARGLPLSGMSRAARASIGLDCSPVLTGDPLGPFAGGGGQAWVTPAGGFSEAGVSSIFGAVSSAFAADGSRRVAMSSTVGLVAGLLSGASSSARSAIQLLQAALSSGGDSDVGGRLVALAGQLMGQIPQLTSAASGMLGGALSGGALSGLSIGQLFRGIEEQISQFISTDDLEGLLSSVRDGLLRAPQAAMDALRGTFDATVSAATTAIGALPTAIRGIYDSAMGAISNLVNSVTSALKNSMKSISSLLSSITGAGGVLIRPQGLSIVDGVGEWLEAVPKAVQATVSAVSGVVSGIMGIPSQIMSQISSMLNSLDIGRLIGSLGAGSGGSNALMQLFNSMASGIMYAICGAASIASGAIGAIGATGWGSDSLVGGAIDALQCMLSSTQSGTGGALSAAGWLESGADLGGLSQLAGLLRTPSSMCPGGAT